MGGVTRYLSERFPVAPVTVLAVGTAIFLAAVANAEAPTAVTYVLTALIAMTFVAFLLRQRVSDEFKDRRHDDANFPDRPLQRGAVRPRTLIGLGLAAVIVELAGVIAVAGISGRWMSAVTYLGVALFSVLTAFEFFAPSWFARHFTLYFVSHQLIFVFFALWAFAVFSPTDIGRFVAGSIAFVVMMAALEIMRKFEIRRDPHGEVVPDTYLAVWGRRACVGILAVAFVVSGALMSQTDGSALTLIGVAFAIGLVIARNSNRAVQGTTILGFFALGVTGYLT